jgi:hypothetical protein
MRNETDEKQRAFEDGNRTTVVSAKTAGKRLIWGLGGRIMF